MTGYSTVSESPAQPSWDADRLIALDSEAAHLEPVALSPVQITDLALILNGAFSPLRGYMSEADYETVLTELRLAGGQSFPLPVVLDVDMTTARAMEKRRRIALRDSEGAALAVLTVEDVWRKDSRRESQILGVDEQAYGRGSCYVGGTVEGIRLPAHPFYAHLRPDPAALVKHIRQRGYGRVLGVECGNVISKTSHEVITRAAAELDAAIVLHTAIGAPDPGNQSQVLTIKCHLAALPYFPRSTLLALLNYSVRHAGVREVLLHAQLRKRHGATHFMMRGATQSLIDTDPRFPAFLDQLGVKFVAWPGHGGEIPESDTFPEVASVLEAHRHNEKRSGFTLFFTGLSGSGKSTIAKIVQSRVAERDPRSVTLLDGDIVRGQSSKGLGFSRQDRDTNVRRIGAAAADITKGGGVAICCPIAPYAETRKAVRAIIEPYGPMIEIHVTTPLEVCERRDPKGLYKKAREGRIQNFTGVDDPYEAPQNPDIRLDASEGTADAAAALVIAHLEKTDLIAANSASPEI